MRKTSALRPLGVSFSLGHWGMGGPICRKRKQLTGCGSLPYLSSHGCKQCLGIKDLRRVGPCPAAVGRRQRPEIETARSFAARRAFRPARTSETRIHPQLAARVVLRAQSQHRPLRRCDFQDHGIHQQAAVDNMSDQRGSNHANNNLMTRYRPANSTLY